MSSKNRKPRPTHTTVPRNQLPPWAALAHRKHEPQSQERRHDAPIEIREDLPGLDAVKGKYAAELDAGRNLARRMFGEDA